MNCIVCGLLLERCFPDTQYQPSDGLICDTYGNYGSRVYDSLGPEHRIFWICDECFGARIHLTKEISR